MRLEAGSSGGLSVAFRLRAVEKIVEIEGIGRPKMKSMFDMSWILGAGQFKGKVAHLGREKTAELESKQHMPEWRRQKHCARW